ncbi:MAG: hypothetical protein ACK5CL_02675 [Sphingomonadales bacterium]|jgi:hypothetical protein
MYPIYRGISYLFYPGSMAVVGLGVAHQGTAFSPLVWMLFMFGMVILPLFSLFLYMRMGKVSDVFIFRREQRHGLYALGVLFSLLTAYLIFRENAILAMVWSACNMAVLLFLLIINIIGYKVSAHMAGVSGLLAWVLCLPTSNGAVLLACALIVLVYIARKGLSAHSHFELILGFCLGLFVTFAMARFLLTYHGITCSFI